MFWYKVLVLSGFLEFYASAADIYVVGITNQNSEKGKPSEVGDVVNININNYCPDTSVTVIKECFCVTPDKCNDAFESQVDAKSRHPASLIVAKCYSGQVCCFNVSNNQIDVRAKPLPTSSSSLPITSSPPSSITTQTRSTTETSTAATTPSTTVASPEYVTEIITSITIINVTRLPTTSDVVGSPSVATDSTVDDKPNVSQTSDSPNTEPSQEQISNGPTQGETISINDFEVEIITPPSPSIRLLCGTRSLYDRRNSRIITPFVSPASVGEFPWTVSILQKGASGDDLKIKCVGSLVQAGVVLTAGKCIDREPTNYVIRAGSVNPLQRDAQIQPWQQRDVVILSRNPQIDVVLLFLTEDFVLNDYVTIICLPPPTSLPLTWCISAGWINNTGDLHRIELRLEEPKNCQERNKNFNNSFVCAATSAYSNQPKFCGDGLVCRLPGDRKFTQVGIGLTCGTFNGPSAYHAIALLRDWLTEELSLK